MSKLTKLIEKIAQKYNVKANILPNGVVVLIRNNEAFVQISAIRNTYYVRYLTKDKDYAYVLYRMNEKIIEKIINEQLDEEPEALKIPDI